MKIPKKWDDSFAAFNQIVQESGLDLADYKGKTVEKWTVLCPQLSTGDHDTYCVLLVYKAKAVGAYLLQKAVRRGDRELITAAKAGAESRLGGGNRGNFRRRLPGGVNAVDAAGRALLARAHAVGADSISARGLRRLPFIHPTTVPAAAQTPRRRAAERGRWSGG